MKWKNYWGLKNKKVKVIKVEEDIKKQLSKLGNTPFKLEQLEIEKDNNIFINCRNTNNSFKRYV